jgi:hypothetical protein
MDQVIEAQLEAIGTQEIAGAYRCLCGMMLTQTVVAYRRRVSRSDDADAKRTAKRWVSGEPGVISFSECCEALDLDMERAREALQSLV